MDKKELLEKQAAEVFTPSQPITDPKLFSGRQELLEQLKGFVNVSGRNFVFYGERGVGKTSFYNILFKNSKAQMHTCSKRDDFVTIFLNILSRLGEQFTDDERKALAEAGYSFGADKVWSVSSKMGAENVYKPVAEQKLNLGFLINKFKNLQKPIDVIILDEFQNIDSPEIQTDIIEVVKGISDNNIKTQIAIVGVATSDEELLTSPEYPQYKMRHFIAAEIPEMNLEELKDIVNKRQDRFKIRFGEEEKEWIARISSGSPSVTHSLALGSTLSWITRKVVKVASNLLILTANPTVANIVGTLFGLNIQKVNINVERADLVSAVANWIKIFHSNNKLASKSYVDILQSSDAGTVQKLLIMLAENNDNPSPVGKIAKSLHVDATKIKKLINNKLKFFVKRIDHDKYILAAQSFRPYIRSWDYLKAQDPESYAKTLKSLSAPD